MFLLLPLVPLHQQALTVQEYLLPLDRWQAVQIHFCSNHLPNIQLAPLLDLEACIQVGIILLLLLPS